MMTTSDCPDALVIGRIVVYTRNRFLAREIERLVEQEGLPDRMSDGRMLLDGQTTHWVVLPSARAASSAHTAAAA